MKTPSVLLKNSRNLGDEKILLFVGNGGSA